MVLSSSSLSRPSTPSHTKSKSTTPKSRTTSPTKPTSSSTSLSTAHQSTSSAGSTSFNSSLNTSIKSLMSLQNKRSNSKLSNLLSTSPSKKDGVGLFDSLQIKASNSTLKQFGSNASIISLSQGSKASRNREEIEESERSFDTTTEEDDSDEEEEEEDKPVRKAGFGAVRATTGTGSARSTFTTTRASARTSTRNTDDESTSGLFSGKTSDTRSLTDREAAVVDDDEDEEPVDGKAVNVVVCLRVRPTRLTSLSDSIYNYDPKSSLLKFGSNHPVFVKRGGATSSRSSEYEFRFDRLHTPPSPSEELYDDKIRPIVRAAMKGFNGTVFAYGQTASGKTHTMMGNQSEPGIIPLAIDELFTFIHRQNDSRSFSLRVSFLEIYNEQLRDLLISNPKSIKPLEVVGEEGVVKGLEERPVSMPSEVLALLHEGDQRRRVGATDWNERSSRSHSVFVVTIESMSRDGTGIARTSRLNLIDLAGSESATGQDDRRKEGSFINKSLLTLGTVIGKLSEGKNAGTQHIPYRDSKLTRLLQPALSGKSRVAVICTMSPDAEQATETLSTLKFARRAKMVVTKAERGVLMTDQMMLNMYEKQVEALKQQIAQRESAVEETELARQRDLAQSRADELEHLNRKNEDELAMKELELTRLREQLEHTKSFILTGPVLEANARRTSIGGAAFGAGGILSPSRGKRIASDMSALGLGTPIASKLGLRGASSSITQFSTPKPGTMDKEIELEKQLEEANRKLAELQSASEEADSLRTRVVELTRSVSLARVNAETSASDRRERIRELEQRLADSKDKLHDVEAEVERLQSEIKAKELEIDDLRRRLEEAHETNTQLVNAKAGGDAAASSLATSLELSRSELSNVKSELVEAKAELEKTSGELEKKSRCLLDSEAKARETLKQLEGSQRLTTDKIVDLERSLLLAREGQDEATKSLEKELASARKALEEEVASKTKIVHEVELEATAALHARNIALDAEAKSRARVVELEALVAQRDEDADRLRQDLLNYQALFEKQSTVVVTLESNITGVRKTLTERETKIDHLQRLVDQHIKREADNAQYEANRRVGAESLQARLAAMQSSTSSRASSNLSSSQRSAKTSSGSGAGRLSAGKDLDTVADLRTRNSELVARIEELEKALELASGNRSTRSSTPVPRMRRSGSSSIDLAKSQGPADLMERRELHSIIDGQKKEVEGSRAAAEEYRKKYLASQALVERLSLSSAENRENRKPDFESNSTIDSARSSFAELNMPQEARRAYAPTLSRTTTSSSSSSSSSTYPQLGRSTWVKDVPPPLPCSPRNADRERQHRRATISKEIDQLKQAKEVLRKREGFDTPPSSPVKKSSGRFADEMDGGAIKREKQYLFE